MKRYPISQSSNAVDAAKISAGTDAEEAPRSLADEAGDPPPESAINDVIATGSANMNSHHEQKGAQTSVGLVVIDDEEPPINLHNFEDQKVKGTVEYISQDSGPQRESYDAMTQHDDSLSKVKKRGHVEAAILSPPSPTDLATLRHDDSVDRARAKEQRLKDSEACVRNINDSINEPNEDDHDLQPVHVLPRKSTSSSAQDEADVPDPISQTHYSDPDVEVAPNQITADAQTMSPYFNHEGAIMIPEATAVDPEDIPSATVVHPDKYSLTIAGRKVQLRFLVLGILLLIGVIVVSIVVPLAINSKSSIKEEVANKPSSAPSVSVYPSSAPSKVPSSSPTSMLHAEILDILSNRTHGTLSISTINAEANRQRALDWLVDDQTAWREENRTLLSDIEIVERFVLALFYFETHGDEWEHKFGFISKDHICKWKGRILRTYSKGVTKCTGDMRVKNITMFNNDLKGFLPAEIGLLTELNGLHMGSNDLEGEIPEALQSLRYITHLDLNGNDFSGQIGFLAGMSSLQEVDLSDNEMTGSLADIDNLYQLESFKVNKNKFSGTVPKSFSYLWSLETLHLDDNRLTGDVEFLCRDLPEKFELDCYDDEPEVTCNCCIRCTIVSDSDCDPNTEELITMNIHAGLGSDGFQWNLRDDRVTIVAGGEYFEGQEINIQLCLTLGRHYYISTTTPVPTASPSTYKPSLLMPTSTEIPVKTAPPTDDSCSVLNKKQCVKDISCTWDKPVCYTTKSSISPTHGPAVNRPSTSAASDSLARVSFLIDGYNSYNSTLTSNDAEEFYLAPNPTVSPTALPTLHPTISDAPSTSSQPSPSTSTPAPSTPAPSSGSTPTVGTNKTLAPTPRYTRPPILPIDRCAWFELNIVTDAFGLDTTWELFQRNYNTVIYSQGGLDSNATLQYTHCLDPNGCYDFIIRDDFDDGICCEQGKGSYNVSVDGWLIGSGGEFESSETVFLGGGSCADTAIEGWAGKRWWEPTPFPTEPPITPFPTEPVPTISPTLSFYPSISTEPSLFPSTTVRPSTSRFPSVAPTATSFPSLSLAPTEFPTFFRDDLTFCNGLKIKFNLTADVSDNTGWELMDQYDDNAVYSYGPLIGGRDYHFEKCTIPSGCYNMVINGATQYAVSVNERLIESGEEFTYSRTVFLGGSCGINATLTGQCPKDYSLLNVTIETDSYGCETSWDVFDTTTGHIFATNKNTLESTSNTSLATCIPNRDCYNFGIYDTFGDGGPAWQIVYNGDFIAGGNGKDFGGYDSKTFGPDCPPTPSPTFQPVTPLLTYQPATSNPITPFPTEPPDQLSPSLFN